VKLYNTLTKKIEEFVPRDRHCVTMYTCGPTVYHYAHIGNLRTYIFEDILEKGLEYLGYSVKRVMNITDVGHMTSDADTGEDKMVKGALREGKTPQELADFYTKAFLEDMKKLSLKVPSILEKASMHIDDYIHVISVLLDKGFAYIAGGNVYFDVSKAVEYYRLSGKDVTELIVGAREDVHLDESKKNPFDFGLWFTKSKFGDQDQKWDSPWGVGYPGWHIECSTLASVYLGEYLDIHCGGVDNIFPHHTNEIAQSEAYFGHSWCRYWLHGEHLNTSHGKMSKSSGEFLTLSLLEQKGYSPLAYKYFCLGSHYRNQLVFSYESLDTASRAYIKLRKKVLSLKRDEVINEELLKSYIAQFKEAIENDLNTSSMLSLVYEVLKDSHLNDSEKYSLVCSFNQVLSLDLDVPFEVKDVDTRYIEEMILKRDVCKKEKNYQEADRIRDELLQMGVQLIDTKDGTLYEVL